MGINEYGKVEVRYTERENAAIDRQMMTLCCVSHARLGAASTFAGIDRHVLQHICEILEPSRNHATFSPLPMMMNETRDDFYYIHVTDDIPGLRADMVDIIGEGAPKALVNLESDNVGLVFVACTRTRKSISETSAQYMAHVIVELTRLLTEHSGRLLHSLCHMWMIACSWALRGAYMVPPPIGSHGFLEATHEIHLEVIEQLQQHYCTHTIYQARRLLKQLCTIMGRACECAVAVEYARNPLNAVGVDEVLSSSSSDDDEDYVTPEPPIKRRKVINID